MANGVHVEQTLRRVCVATITGVDHMHMRCDMLSDEMRRTRLAMAHYKNIGSHSAQIGDGVKQGLALAGRRARNIQIEHVGGQARGGNLKRCSGSRAVLEEQIENTFAAQQGNFFHFAVVDRYKVGRMIQDMRQDVARQSFCRKQMDQLAVLIELRVALVEHVSLPPKN